MGRIARKAFSLVVFHSTYIPAHLKIATVCRGAGVPYILTPRAGLTDQAQARKRWKKALANRLGFGRFVRGASALHFLTPLEKSRSRTWGRPSFVVGNGIDLPNAADQRDSVTATDQPIRVCFIGRLSIRPKGIDLLLDALALWAKEDHSVADRVNVSLYGPGSRREREWIQNKLGQEKLAPWVSLEEAVAGSAKAEVLVRSDLFVHTSRFEGMPMAVLEALSYGTPCLLSPGTGLADEVEQAGAGIAVGSTVESVANALAGLDRQALRRMRPSARAFAEQRSWPIIARDTLNAYRPYRLARQPR
mgnify:FL=1